MTIDELTDNIKSIRKLQRDYSEYLVGTIETWASIMENYPDMTPTIIIEMKNMALKIKEITGVLHDT